MNPHVLISQRATGKVASRFCDLIRCVLGFGRHSMFSLTDPITEVLVSVRQFHDSAFIIIIIILLQCAGHSRPSPVQKFNFWTCESIWTFGRTPWMGDQPDASPLLTQDNTT